MNVFNLPNPQIFKFGEVGLHIKIKHADAITNNKRPKCIENKKNIYKKQNVMWKSKHKESKQGTGLTSNQLQLLYKVCTD